METLLDSEEITPGIPTRFAGFWIRFVAYIIDGIILNLIFTVIGFIIGLAQAEYLLDLEQSPEIAAPIIFLLLLLGLGYFVGMESSEKQATIGKMAMNIKVVDDQGQRLSTGRAAGRFFGKILSGIILYIGFIMVAFHPQKKGLHDVMANTLVVYK